MSLITLEFLQELLRDEYRDVTITDYEGAPSSKRGDNYTSMVYRITLRGSRTRSDDTGETIEPWEGSLIYKCLPECRQLRIMFKSEELFCNEVAFYKKIWPAMLKFQSQWNIAHPFKAIPKCFLARNDLVILKDLKEFGFTMPDRKQGFTIEQCYYVLKHLSQFHALPLAMKYYDPEGFFDLLNMQDGISEVFFVTENIEYYRSYYTEAIANAINMVDEGLKDVPDKEKYLDKFKTFCSEETFFQDMVDMVVPKEPLAVICHGDCWTNNIMFRYVDGDIAEMYMVDFQLARYASPSIDLAYLLYLCLDREQRAEHKASLLEYYIEELHKRLMEMSDGGTIMEKETLSEMLHEEFRRISLFGLGSSLDMLPIMTCDSDEAPNLYQEKDQESDVPSLDSPKPVWTDNEACRKKLTDLVIEFVDEGLL